MLAVMLCGAMGLPAWSQDGAQQALGVLVRLEPGDQTVTGTPRVELAPLDGSASIDLTLNDDGAPPDVTAKDGRWAGLALTPITAFAVTVTMDGGPLRAGEVRWKEDAGARDLVLTLSADGVTAAASATAMGSEPSSASGEPPLGNEAGAGEASTAAGAPADGAAAPGVAMGGSAAVAPGGQMSPDMATPPLGAPVAGTTTTNDDGWIWLALGVGAIGLVASVVLLSRRREDVAGEVDLDRAPEPPLFGGASPTLDRGLSVWQVAWADRDALLSGLVGALAQHHRVLFVASDSEAVPAAMGGPVYVCRDTDLRRVEGHIADILEGPGRPLVPVMVEAEPTAERIAALLAVLDTDLGGVLVTAGVPAGVDDVVRVTVQADGAVLQIGADQIELVRGRFGYVPRE